MSQRAGFMIFIHRRAFAEVYKTSAGQVTPGQNGEMTSTLDITAAGAYKVSILLLDGAGNGTEPPTTSILSYNLSVQAGVVDPAASSAEGPGLHTATVGLTSAFQVHFHLCAQSLFFANGERVVL